jgi:hypothetical protein
MLSDYPHGRNSFSAATIPIRIGRVGLGKSDTALLHRRLPVPRLDTRPPPQRIRGDIERREAQHLLCQPWVSLQQIGLGLPLRQQRRDPVHYSRRGPRRSIFRNPPSSHSVSRGASSRALNTSRRKPGTKRSANRRSNASEIEQGGVYIKSVGTGPSDSGWLHPPRPAHPGNQPVSHTHDRSPRCQSAGGEHTPVFNLR